MVKAVNFRISAFAAFGIVCGILFSYFRLTDNLAGEIVSISVAALLLILFTFFSSVKFKSMGKVLCFLFFACFFAVGYFSFTKLTDNFQNADLNGNILTVSGSVSEISESESYSQIILDSVKFSGAVNGKSDYKIALSVYGDNTLKLGDKITFIAPINNRTLFYENKFSASALAQGIKYFAEINSENITKTASSPDIFEKCNLYIFDTLKAGLKADEFAVAYAMLTGNSDYMTTENLTAYRNLGVAHIFAVSGLHIGFLATAIYFILNKLKINRNLAFIITLFATVFYAGICGFSASSVRAVIMFFFLNFARILGLKYDSISAVFTAALVILLFNPAELFCAGFLLSFSVVITVLVLYNPLTRLLKFLPKKFAAAFIVSFSAELGSAPVLLCFFGEFPALSLFVNILFIPVAGVIFIALILGVLLGGIFSPTVFLFLQEYALFGLNFIVKLLDFKAFLVGGFTLGIFCLAYYSAISVAGGLVNFKRLAKIAVCVILSITVVVGTFIKTANTKEQITATVIGGSDLSAVLIASENENMLIISEISYKNFQRYRLSKALSKTNGEKVTVVLLSQSKNVELVGLTVRLYGLMDIDRLYYYGEQDTVTEKVMASAFNGLEAISLKDGDKIPAFGGKCGYELYGKCFYLAGERVNTAVFSSLLGDSYSGLDVLPSTVIFYDSEGGLLRALSPKLAVSFKKNAEYPDGETQGNYTFVLGG